MSSARIFTSILARHARVVRASPESFAGHGQSLEKGCVSVQHCQVRFRGGHPAKMGQHLGKLDDLAHEQSHQEAQERRKKKKEKKLTKKGSKEGDAHGKSTGNDAESDDDWEEDNHDDEDGDDTDPNVLPDPAETKERMKTIVDQYVESLKGIRGAEPSANLFDSVTVNAYGSNVPLNTVAQVTISSGTLAYANCFDPSLAKNVATAIRNQMENLNPSVEEHGQVKIPLPRVSMETRQKTAQQLKKRTEQYRLRIRGVRRNVLNVVKKGLAGKLEHVSKDDAFRVQTEIEHVTEDFMKKLSDAADRKEKEIVTA
jgi:ribosome recycling factor